MNLTSTSQRRAGAAVAVGALAASTTLLFAPAAQAATTSVLESQIAKSGTSTDGWYQNGTAGAFRVVNTGLELSGGAQVLKGNAGSTTSDFADLAAATVAVTGGTAPFEAQLTDDNAIQGTATLTKTDAPDAWVSDKPVGTTVPITAGRLSDFEAAVGTGYKITGFGVGSTGTATVSNITFDGTTYLFANNAPVAKDRSLSTKLNTPVSIPLTATDVDGNALTYTITGVVGGSVSGTGAAQTFTPTTNFRGSASVRYTADDGRGGVATATVTIQVEKLKGKVEIYRIKPSSKISVRNTVSVYASVKVDGKQAPRGTTVYGYAKGKKVVTGKVNSLGKVKVTLPNKLPAGKSTLKVTQVGSSKLNGGTDSIVVRVRK